MPRIDFSHICSPVKAKLLYSYQEQYLLMAQVRTMMHDHDADSLYILLNHAPPFLHVRCKYKHGIRFYVKIGYHQAVMTL